MHFVKNVVDAIGHLADFTLPNLYSWIGRHLAARHEHSEAEHINRVVPALLSGLPALVGYGLEFFIITIKHRMVRRIEKELADWV